MSEENVKIIKQCVAAYEAGGFEATRDFCDPGIELAQLMETVQSPAHGFDAAVDSMRDWQSAFKDFHAEPSEFIDAGDHVIVVLQEHGTPKGGGVEMQQTYYMLYTLRAGRIVRLAWFRDRHEALRAAGLES